MVAIITSPTAVGVGTTEKSVYTEPHQEQNSGTLTYKNITSLRANYRGAICVNDSGQLAGDYDDLILRCYEAVFNNYGSTPANAIVTDVKYTNVGAFYGQPVSMYQTGNVPHIFGGDGTTGNAAASSGGVGIDNNWRRLTNLTYMYSVDSDTLAKYTYNTNSPPDAYSAGQFHFGVGGGNTRIYINKTDANGNSLYDFFDNLDNSSSPAASSYHLKITSLNKTSSTDPWSGEKKYMYCKIISDSSNGNLFSNRFLYGYEVIASNINLLSNGGSSNTEDWGDCVIEFIPPVPGTTSPTKDLTFFLSRESAKNVGILISNTKCVDGTYTHNVHQFVRGDCTLGPQWNLSNGYSFTNKTVSLIHPNLQWRVWGYIEDAHDPKCKLINIPNPTNAES